MCNIGSGRSHKVLEEDAPESVWPIIVVIHYLVFLSCIYIVHSRCGSHVIFSCTVWCGKLRLVIGRKDLSDKSLFVATWNICRMRGAYALEYPIVIWQMDYCICVYRVTSLPWIEILNKQSSLIVLICLWIGPLWLMLLSSGTHCEIEQNLINYVQLSGIRVVLCKLDGWCGWCPSPISGKVVDRHTTGLEFMYWHDCTLEV